MTHARCPRLSRVMLFLAATVAGLVISPPAGAQQPAQGQPPQPRQHPLVPCIEWANSGLEKMEQYQDYECTLVKRERIGEKLGESVYIYTRIRQKPFSVYMYFLTPKKDKGQQVVYIEGQNDGNLLAKPVGLVKGKLGPFSLDPKGNLAMNGQRYPITEVGIKNLTVRLLEVAENDKHFGECSVNFFRNTKINDRPTTCIEVTHPVPRRNFRFHVARVFVDDQWNIPTRYEAYLWPEKPGDKPVLVEEYTYLNLKFNNGFTDDDFVIRRK